MSSPNLPPTSNPTFNASDFVTATSTGFDTAQGDARYLQLAAESTCTAIETFSARTTPLTVRPSGTSDQSSDKIKLMCAIASLKAKSTPPRCPPA